MPVHGSLGDIARYHRAVVHAVGSEAMTGFVWLRGRYLAGPIAADGDFQRAFRHHYRLNSAGLTEAFMDRYFAIMDECRDGHDHDVGAIALALYQVPHSRGYRSLQYSFVTKLVNMVDPTRPVFDAHVAAVFGFRRLPSAYPLTERLEHLSAFYRALEGEYRSVLASAALTGPIELLRRSYGVTRDAVADTKALDFLVGAAGRLGFRLEPAYPAR